ncbi:MAG: sulfurtransferase [Gammaproteobacteria bacterium]|nr:sulfurtransferase [Gammaproteobacteria bacterium]
MTDYHNSQYLTTALALGEQFAEPDLRIVDATVFLHPAATGYRAESGWENYCSGHLPGAVFMDQVREFSDTSTGLGFSRPTPEALAESLGALGISHEHRVVIYSTGHVMWATRAWWLLRYAGHDRVAVLDGGLRAWQAAGLPVTTDIPAYPAVAYRPAPRPELFVDKDEVVSGMNDPAVCTVNALSPEVYAGTGDMHYGRRGHIPGSLNVHYDAMLESGHFKPAADLRAALQAQGLLDAPRLIAYCGGGISATVDGFACQLSGKEEVAVYDGSMADWVRDESLPLTTGTEP